MNKYLPIGTVVKVEEAGEMLFMISGLVAVNSEGEKRDYVATKYPIGFIGNDKVFFFNHNQITEIVHEGYLNEDHKIYVQLIEEAIKNNDTSD